MKFLKIFCILFFATTAQSAIYPNRFTTNDDSTAASYASGSSFNTNGQTAWRMQTFQSTNVNPTIQLTNAGFASVGSTNFSPTNFVTFSMWGNPVGNIRVGSTYDLWPQYDDVFGYAFYGMDDNAGGFPAPFPLLVLSGYGNMQLPAAGLAFAQTNGAEGAIFIVDQSGLNWVNLVDGTNFYGGFHGKFVGDGSGLTGVVGSGTVTSVNVAEQGYGSSGAITTSGTVTLTPNANVNALGYASTNHSLLTATNNNSPAGVFGTAFGDPTNVLQIGTLGLARAALINTNGDASFNGNLHAASTAQIDGNVNMGNDLTVGGALTVGGLFTADISANLLNSGTLDDARLSLTVAHTNQFLPLGTIQTNQYAFIDGTAGVTNIRSTLDGEYWTNLSPGMATNNAGAPDGYVPEKTGNNFKLVPMTGGGGGGGASALAITNILVTNTAAIVLDLSIVQSGTLQLLTNAAITFSNIYGLTNYHDESAMFHFWQDTNGGRSVTIGVANGILRTNNNNWTGTNADEMDTLRVFYGPTGTNLLANFITNWLPALSYTNSLSGGGGLGGGGSCSNMVGNIAFTAFTNNTPDTGWTSNNTLLTFNGAIPSSPACYPYSTGLIVTNSPNTALPFANYAYATSTNATIYFWWWMYIPPVAAMPANSGNYFEVASASEATVGDNNNWGLKCLVQTSATDLGMFVTGTSFTATNSITAGNWYFYEVSYTPNQSTNQFRIYDSTLSQVGTTGTFANVNNHWWKNFALGIPLKNNGAGAIVIYSQTGIGTTGFPIP